MVNIVYSFSQVVKLIYLLILFSILSSSCVGQNKTQTEQDGKLLLKSKSTDSTQDQDSTKAVLRSWNPYLQPDIKSQISPFIRRIFQDQSGIFWFGTNGDGVVRYNLHNADENGQLSMEYFSIDEGFAGIAVRGIVEDKNGNLWFGTESGLSKYDGTLFRTFTQLEGLIHNDIWCITLDSKGILWIGTYDGVCYYDGKGFTHFSLPDSEPDHTRGVTSARIVHSIMEDRRGRMWFATNGGAYVYDESDKTLSHLSEKDGLGNNVLNCILEDIKGNIWFATHHNGVCRLNNAQDWLNGKQAAFSQFGQENGVKGVEAWDLFQDKEGNIWFPMEGYGVYRYSKPSLDDVMKENLHVEEQNSFTNFSVEEGLSSLAIQCTFQDNHGHIWFGGWLGLYYFENPSENDEGKEPSIINVTKNGPWPGN